MTTFRIRILYALYALAAVVFFLFFLFPAESVKKGFIDRIERTYSPYQLRIKALGLSLPFGILMRELSLTNSNETLINISKLELSPKLFQLTRGQKSIRFNGTAYEGHFSGEIDCKKENWNLPEKLSLFFSSLKIKEAPLKVIESSPLFSGILDGNLTYSQSEKSADIIDATLTLKEITLTLPGLSAEIAKLAFEKMDAAFSIEKQTLTFRQFVFSGPQIEGNIAGTIRFAEPAAKSNLNLRMEISIRPEFQDKLSQIIPLVLLPNRNSSQNGYKFRIFGTLDKPGFSIAR